MITYWQAIILGLLQGITELFPISSLGHSVLLPWLLNWNSVLHSESAGESFYLPFIVILHVATALALLVFYRKTWWRIIKGFFCSVRHQRIDNPDARLAWLLLAATIPTAIIGLAFEHSLRVQFAKPLSAIILITVNGFILLLGDHYLTKQHTPSARSVQQSTEEVSGRVSFWQAMAIGVAQIGALFAGISRSGITMISGLYVGLNREDAARFSFLLATPVILGAGLIKLPDFLNNQLVTGARGQILVGGLTTAIAAYIAVRFLDKYFQNRTLKPFGFYCIGLGIVLLIVGLLRGHF